VRERLGALLELLIPSVCPACDAPRASGDTLLCAACARGLRALPRLRAVHTAIAYEGRACCSSAVGSKPGSTRSTW
jgi:predicted amidophosphoribosyltransferase